MKRDAEQVLGAIERVLVCEAEFASEAVLRDYPYADYLGNSQLVRRVPLAAFSETPPSYRSARVAVTLTAADQASDHELSSLRGLGAPRVVTIGPSQASVWRFGEDGRPAPVEDHPRGDIANVIRTRAVDWTPSAILRSTAVSAPGLRQLDFGDLGLVPLIEKQVNAKLDHLIREVLAGCTERDPVFQRRRGFARLVRGIFWLLAAKVLVDREHPDVGTYPDSGNMALAVAQRHYEPAGSDHRLSSLLLTTAVDREVIDWAWQRIRSGFHFQNLSSDALAFVYENTLVSPEVRQRLGIHGTPRAIAELITELLPLEDLPHGQDVILEPCCGFAPFLLASMRRLRQRALSGLEAATRHAELVRRLRGIEFDPFAVEVGRLCLTLADYPNADGWQLRRDDVFATGVLERDLTSVGAVLSNPPFEAFQASDMRRYGAIRAEKPAELLRRVLDSSNPQQLGIVLPRMVLDSPRSGYRDLRRAIRRDFREVDTIDLPDSVFEHSDAETALVIARCRREGKHTALRSARIRPQEVKSLLQGQLRPDWHSDSVVAADQGLASLRVDDLASVWRRLSHLTKLGDISQIHQGIQYWRSLKTARAELISEVQRPGLVPGVHKARDIRPYKVVRESYLCIDDEEIRRSGGFPWAEPKVVVNATRRSRGFWPLLSVPDSTGLWCYQNLHGVWPTDLEEWPVEIVAAVLNGPVANATVASRENKRHVRLGTLAEIPVPDRSRLDVPRIIDLVQQATRSPDLDRVLRIDAEILRGYDLPPRVERQLLRRFEGEERPGVSGFYSYYPTDFDSALPLHRILGDLRERHRASRLVKEVPVLHRPEVSELFENLLAGYDS